MTSNKYIIKNCPCYTHKGGYYDCWANQDTWCQNITDCKLKQIVELCRHYKKHSDCGRECPSFGMFLSKLLSKLDIDEVLE